MKIKKIVNNKVTDCYSFFYKTFSFSKNQVTCIYMNVSFHVNYRTGILITGKESENRSCLVFFGSPELFDKFANRRRCGWHRKMSTFFSFPQNHRAHFNQHCHNGSSDKGDSSLLKKNCASLQGEIIKNQ